MDADKFIDIAYKCGYSTKGNAKKYVKDNPKEDYDMDDLIVLHEGKIQKCILMTVQMSVTPIVISGLVKGSDAVTSRMF